MTDIVIPLGWGSQWQNNELKYSLRSFEKHLSGMGQVFIVTDLVGVPNWLDGIIHIPCPDMTNTASLNAYTKVLKACQDDRVSQSFLLSNDDFFLIKDFEASTFPQFFRGELREKHANPKDTHYPNSKMNTFRELERFGMPKRHYGVHCPMLLDKSKFQFIMSRFNWNTKDGILMRSLYGNMAGVGGTLMKDCKISDYMDLPGLRKTVEGKPFFSIGDTAINRDMMNFLEELYPNKSRYEK